jgi:hypothetical protein
VLLNKHAPHPMPDFGGYPDFGGSGSGVAEAKAAAYQNAVTVAVLDALSGVQDFLDGVLAPGALDSMVRHMICMHVWHAYMSCVGWANLVCIPRRSELGLVHQVTLACFSRTHRLWFLRL